MPDPLHAFADTRRAVAASLQRAADGLPTELAAATQARLRELATRTRDGRFTLVLLGAFSSGKSSLINALLGAPALPVKVNPCTAVLTEVVHAASPLAQVHYTDGTEAAISLDELRHAFQLEGEAEQSGAERDQRFSHLDRLRLGFPAPLLRDGVVLVDTPGLDDDDRRTQRTLQALPDADAVLVVLNATRFFTPLERHALQHHLAPLGLQNLFFPITMVDLLHALSEQPEQERDRLEQRAHHELHHLCPGPPAERVHLLDNRGALRARWQGEHPRDPVDHEAWRASGLEGFEGSLQRFLVHDRGRAQLHQVLATLDAERAQLDRRAALDAATATLSAQALQDRQTNLQPQLAALSEAAARVERIVDRFIDQRRAAVWTELRDLLDRAEDDLPRALAEAPLGALPAVRMLGPGGRDALAVHLRDHVNGWLSERLDACTVRNRQQLAASLDELHDQLQPELRDLDALAQQITGAFLGAAIALPEQAPPGLSPSQQERWLSVLLGAALLSPGAMAAGWTDGLHAVTLGAFARLGARLGVVTLGAVLGPVGQVGLLFYAAADAGLLLLTGDREIERLRAGLRLQLAAHLATQREPLRVEVEQHVQQALAPLRAQIVQAAHDRAAAVHTLIHDTVAMRAHVQADAQRRAALWSDALNQLSQASHELRGLIP